MLEYTEEDQRISNQVEVESDGKTVKFTFRKTPLSRVAAWFEHPVRFHADDLTIMELVLPGGIVPRVVKSMKTALPGLTYITVGPFILEFSFPEGVEVGAVEDQLRNSYPSPNGEALEFTRV